MSDDNNGGSLTQSAPEGTKAVDTPGAGKKSSVEILEVLDKQKRGAGFTKALTDRTFTGAILFFVITGLALVFFVGLAIVTAATMPTTAMVDSLMPTGTAQERLQAYQDLHSGWIQQTTTLGQLVLFGSIIPVISTIIGYVLGSETKRRD